MNETIQNQLLDFLENSGLDGITVLRLYLNFCKEFNKAMKEQNSKPKNNNPKINIAKAIDNYWLNGWVKQLNNP